MVNGHIRRPAMCVNCGQPLTPDGSEHADPSNPWTKDPCPECGGFIGHSSACPRLASPATAPRGSSPLTTSRPAEGLDVERLRKRIETIHPDGEPCLCVAAVLSMLDDEVIVADTIHYDSNARLAPDSAQEADPWAGYVHERRPGDDEECARYGCEDTTHLVWHRVASPATAPATGLDVERLTRVLTYIHGYEVPLPNRPTARGYAQMIVESDARLTPDSAQEEP
jgi:predicted RNA-binding Zn-ribbon protein involved in translation (DUF1610 family)